MHGKELAVLAVVGALVLWGGAATAVQAPANQATADATDGVTALQEGDADVSFSDQTADDNTVTVDSVTVPEGGYVTIHDSSLLDGDAIGSVVGTSEYLEPGTHESVTVTLDEADDTAMNGTQDLIAMPHMETTDDESYDFVSSEGEDDGPYTTDGEAVVDDAEVTFETDGADQMADNETADTDGAQVGDEDADANETAAEDDAMNETAEMSESGLAISDVEAPAYIPSNESFEVSANITNTGDEEHSEEIAYRLEGGGVDVVVHQNVTLDAGETENITLEVDENLSEDDYIHGITTYNSSEFNELTVTDDALVNFEDQEADGNNVTVEYAYVPEGGYVTVHDSSLQDGEVVGSVVGVSEYLEPGWHNDVNVTLYEGVEGAEFDDEELSGNETLIAMPHMETTDDETYDFVASEGEDDGAYVTDGVPVTDAANVTGAADEEAAPVDEEENETTEAPTDDETTTAEDDEADVGPTPITDGEDNETTGEPAAPDNETDENETDDGMADNATDGEPAAPGNDTGADNATDGEPAAPADDNATDGETDDSDDGGGVAPGLIGSPTDDGEAGAGNETGSDDTTEDDATDTGTEDNTTDTGTEDNTTDTGTEDNATDDGTTDGGMTTTADGEMTTEADGNETTGNETTTEAGA